MLYSRYWEAYEHCTHLVKAHIAARFNTARRLGKACNDDHESFLYLMYARGYMTEAEYLWHD